CSVLSRKSRLTSTPNSPSVLFLDDLENHRQVKPFIVCTHPETILKSGCRISYNAFISRVIDSPFPIVNFSIPIQVFKFNISRSEIKLAAILQAGLVNWFFSVWSLFKLIRFFPSRTVPFSHVFR